MERIEIARDCVYKSIDNQKFSTEEECVRYEYLLAKYADRHKTLVAADGRVNNFYKIFSTDEAHEVAEFARYKVGYYCIPDPNTDYQNAIIWIPNDNMDGYGPCPTMGLLSDFIQEQRDAIDEYSSIIVEAQALEHEFETQSRPDFVIDISPTAQNFHLAIRRKLPSGELVPVIDCVCNNYQGALTTIEQYMNLAYNTKGGDLGI